MTRFSPPVIAASLSGESNSAWATDVAPFVGGAFLGGIAIDEPTRRAAQSLVDRGRSEFLPTDPHVFMADQLAAIEHLPIITGWNVRASAPGPVREAGAICAKYGAILEVNAHCRQDEMCQVGSGETLLIEPDRLAEQVWAAASTGVAVSVKIRTEVDGVDILDVATTIDAAGADLIHVDAMDSESKIGDIEAATTAVVIANNGVRDRMTVREYAEYGADVVSLARPTDDPAVLRRVKTAATELLMADPTPQSDAGTL